MEFEIQFALAIAFENENVFESANGIKIEFENELKFQN